MHIINVNSRAMFCFLLGVLALAGWLVGCEPPAPADPREVEEEEIETPAVDEPEELSPLALDVGDVEAQVWVEGTLDPESDDAGVHGQEMVDQRQRRNIVRIQLEPPYPDELWLRYETTCERNFPDTPAVIRGSFVRDVDEAELGRLAGVFGADGIHTRYSERVDALEGLDSIPDSLLITFQGESLLMEHGTNEEDLDPEEAETSPGRRSEFVYCNPIRVNFLEDEPVEDEPYEDEPSDESEPEGEEPQDEVEARADTDNGADDNSEAGAE